MRFIYRHLIHFIVATLACSSFGSVADPAKKMICKVEGGDDIFEVYPQQMVFEGEQFSIYQIIDGLTVLIINTRTMKFNRLSNLNLLANSTLDPGLPAEPAQFFTGRCGNSALDLSR